MRGPGPQARASARACYGRDRLPGARPWLLVRRDGSLFPIEYWSAPIGMPGGPGAIVAFTDITERRRTESALETIGATVGPYANGWLVDHASWRYVFLLNLPLILAGLLALRYVPEIRTSGRSLSLDAVGSLLAVLGLGRQRGADHGVPRHEVTPLPQ